ncbi:MULTISPECIES: hypothetical protein [unclassified Paenibacillus]|uniref:hypothetical protein n=1 Tax=unclassified Paenibacillus TaxID=185978 RepID=UPI0036A5625A
MIWFILFMAAAIGLSLRIMVRVRTQTKEILVFLVIVLLGLADWISIFTDHKFKPTQLISMLLDLMGL